MEGFGELIGLDQTQNHLKVNHRTRISYDFEFMGFINQGFFIITNLYKPLANCLSFIICYDILNILNEIYPPLFTFFRSSDFTVNLRKLASLSAILHAIQCYLPSITSGLAIYDENSFIVPFSFYKTEN